jgi:hypothetical protein
MDLDLLEDGQERQGSPDRCLTGGEVTLDALTVVFDPVLADDLARRAVAAHAVGLVLRHHAVPRESGIQHPHRDVESQTAVVGDVRAAPARMAAFLAPVSHGPLPWPGGGHASATMLPWRLNDAWMDVYDGVV